MRVLVFHGYLLGGTGSNVYNANLAAALVRLGHEVHLLCQDRAPEQLSFADAAGDWDGGALELRTLRDPIRCTVYRPALPGGVLPVYVADRYDGVDARPFPELSDKAVAAYVEANVAAVREVVELARPEVALANHEVMGPLILARALDTVPYAVKVHGSALEYTVAPHPDRFLAPAREGIGGARGILVGSFHTASRLWETLGDPQLPERTRLGPPGVDVARFAPSAPAEARAGLTELARALAEAATAEAAAAEAAGPAGDPALDAAERSSFDRDVGEAAVALARLAQAPAEDPLVTFVGKLIVSKGVDLLLAAWPLVLAEQPRARLAVVGFGAFRPGLERLLRALAAGDLDAVVALAAEGRAAEGGPEGRSLRHLTAFLDRLAADDALRGRYLAAARELPERVVFTGRLDHDELPGLLPACAAQVVPSTFPEAFGMVAAEAAACGALPVCADHSGLAEVAGALAEAVPPQARELLSFTVGDGAVEAIAARLLGWLALEPELRERTREALVATVRERWSWEGVARGVIAAAEGRLKTLAPPARTDPR
jgi:glycosyltransferase involved in cell wall biosynthesis